MHEELYADGISEITMTGNVVRIDFVSLSPTERDANNKPKAVFRQRIVMPADGFANSAELMKNVLRGLIESGAVKIQQASASASDKKCRRKRSSATSVIGLRREGPPGCPSGPDIRSARLLQRRASI
jgi:hypothetical protein